MLGIRLYIWFQMPYEVYNVVVPGAGVGDFSKKRRFAAGFPGGIQNIIKTK
ncbi:hypothetical protein PATY110618_22435 [Paenibacillus typhae]|uniref:Uncharacterized protein n=1 Tax=Paenibacillus typhae TaxID=1174501 RepID=A0A1G8ZBD5_9BACL|nr:hypothetical protein SAMN05216192_13230 [Paenibacillus typhae]